MNEYVTSATFLPGHFRAFTVKLNALDGVYYCDVRPNMINDPFLSKHIKTVDRFFFTELFEMLDRDGKDVGEVAVKPDKSEIPPGEITDNPALK